MLVEDDPGEITLARQAFAAAHPSLTLDVVQDGDETLAWLARAVEERSPPPRLILLDLKLPKLAGLAVLRRLRLAPYTAGLPIVVFSEVHLPADVLLSYQVGANRFVSKPVDLEQFDALLRELPAYWLQPPQPGRAVAGR